MLVGCFIAAWTWPSDDLPRFYRVMISQGIILLSVLLAAIWWVFLSGVRQPIRLAVLSAFVAVIVAVGALIHAGFINIEFDGDLMPVVVNFRWQPTHTPQFSATHHKANSESLAAALETNFKLTPEDFPEYRNHARDGVVHGPALARDWNVKTPKEIWKKPCGAGFSGFVEVAGRLVTIEQRGGDEVVVCYDAATGNELWTLSYPARFYDFRGGEGPMATPTVDRGLVFSVGGTGRLVCLDFATGELKWDVDLLANNDNLTWGMSGSPLVFDEVVVVNPGEQKGHHEGRALVAFDRKTGKKMWSTGDTRAGYSSPMLATLCGVRQIVLFDGQEIAGYDVSGKGKFWSLPWDTNQGINVAEPLVLPEDRLFISSGYGVGCGIVQVKKDGDKWSAEEVKHAKTMHCRFTSPVEYKGLVYGLNEGTMTCVDPKDLSRKWIGRRYGHGQILLCDDLLLVLTETGELALVQAAGEKSRELGRFKALTGDKTWNYPCLAGGKAYIRNHREMACYDLRSE